MSIQLDYAITRSFLWKWFTPLALLGTVLSIGFLSAINETRNDSHIFNVGDVLTTNYSVFQWIVEGISKGNVGNSAMAYNGTTLEYCDISALFLNGDLRTWTIDLTPVVTRRSPTRDLEINLKSTLSIIYLQGKHVASFGTIQLGWFEARRITDFTTYDPQDPFVRGQLASEDAARRLYTASLVSNGTTPVTISFQADFEYCPASLDTSAPCMSSVPRFNISNAAAILPNVAVHQYTASQPIVPSNPLILTDDTLLPVSSLIQLAHALVRMDLGNGSPNNFILFPERTNATTASSFPVTPFNPPLMSYSVKYDYWNRPNEAVSEVLPLKIDGPASIRMVYLCRFLRAKPWTVVHLCACGYAEHVFEWVGDFYGYCDVFCEESSYAWWVFDHFSQFFPIMEYGVNGVLVLQLIFVVRMILKRRFPCW
ncbi:hypothetical protein BDQ17DRAFT_1365753 [Cyathus striatus]|nr:hypothetical protein BDQ17DRAFT_1365753 [Cyathus striatus]